MDEIELYRQMLTKDPTSETFLYLAEALFERQMYSEAIETCVNGLRLHPHNLRARVILGLSSLRTGNLDRAETELLKALEMLEINTVTYEGLAELYELKGVPEKVALYRERYNAFHQPEAPGVLSQEPELQIEPEPVQAVEEDSEVATVTMAELYVQQGHLEKAAAVYRKILETAPGTIGIEDRLEKLEEQIGATKKRDKLISALKALRSNLQERTTTRPDQIPEQSASLDTEQLAALVRKWFEESQPS